MRFSLSSVADLLFWLLTTAYLTITIVGRFEDEVTKANLREAASHCLLLAILWHCITERARRFEEIANK